MENQFTYWALCQCGARYPLETGRIWDLKFTKCPSCTLFLRRHMRVQKGRFVSVAVWWKPWTWFREEWEEAPDSPLYERVAVFSNTKRGLWHSTWKHIRRVK